MKHLENFNKFKINEISSELKGLAINRAEYLNKKEKNELVKNKRERQKEFFSNHISPKTTQLADALINNIKNNLKKENIVYKIDKKEKEILFEILSGKTTLVNLTVTKKSSKINHIDQLLLNNENETLLRKIEKFITRLKEIEFSKGLAYGWLRKEYNKTFGQVY